VGVLSLSSFNSLLDRKAPPLLDRNILDRSLGLAGLWCFDFDSKVFFSADYSHDSIFYFSAAIFSSDCWSSDFPAAHVASGCLYWNFRSSWVFSFF
jgi:hypothetical protein